MDDLKKIGIDSEKAKKIGTWLPDIDKSKLIMKRKQKYLSFGVSEKEAEELANQEVDLARCLSEFNKTTLESELNRFEFTGKFSTKGLDKIGVKIK